MTTIRWFAILILLVIAAAALAFKVGESNGKNDYLKLEEEYAEKQQRIKAYEGGTTTPAL